MARCMCWVRFETSPSVVACKSASSRRVRKPKLAGVVDAAQNRCREGIAPAVSSSVNYFTDNGPVTR